MSALTGFRIVEIADSVAAEYCGKLLSDFGAEVVKIEAPGCGSKTRAMAPLIVDGPEGSALFGYLNTNKLSVELDVDSAADSDRLDLLVGGADAVIAEHCSAWARRHPAVVFCSITPFGMHAPEEFGNARNINVVHASGWGYHTPSHADPAASRPAS